jgi:hypothetical protein
MDGLGDLIQSLDDEKDTSCKLATLKFARKGLVDMLDIHVGETLGEHKTISNQGLGSQLQEDQNKDKMKKVKRPNHVYPTLICSTKKTKRLKTIIVKSKPVKKKFKK